MTAKYNSAAVLRALLARHPELSQDAERLARSPDDCLGQELLADIRKVFDADSLIPGITTRLGSARITQGLANLPGRPWAKMGRSKRPITAHRLARMLSAYGIRPEHLQLNGKDGRGYRLEQFDAAWGSPAVKMPENIESPTTGDTPVTLSKCHTIRRFIINCLRTIRSYLPFRISALF